MRYRRVRSGVLRVGFTLAPQYRSIAEWLFETHGADVIRQLLPNVVKVLKKKWPDCKTFKGVESYLDDALRPFRQEERRERERRETEEGAAAEQRRQALLERMFDSLPAAEQQKIRSAAPRGQPYGGHQRVQRIAEQLGLESTLRPPHRPTNAPTANKRPSKRACPAFSPRTG